MTVAPEESSVKQLRRYVSQVTLLLTRIKFDKSNAGVICPKFSWSNTITGKQECEHSLEFERDCALYNLAVLEV